MTVGDDDPVAVELVLFLRADVTLGVEDEAEDFLLSRGIFVVLTNLGLLRSLRGAVEGRYSNQFILN